MTGSKRIILLACGSFNPPTNMHLRMFEIARDYLHRTTDYHVVAGLMSPVHDKYGKEGLVGAQERIQMIQLATATSNWLHVSDWETKQEEWTPTKEVLQHHQDIVNSTVNGNLDTSAKRQRLDSIPSWLSQLCSTSEPVRIKLLCGADLLESFKKPGLWKEEDIEIIVGKFGLVVITRTGTCDPYTIVYESDLMSRLQKNIQVVNEWVCNEISSTKVRRALRRGETVKYLLQDSVIDYIYKHSLFQTHNNSKYNISSSSMLTPSPNLETDVLLPPPNSFTLAPPSHHLGGALLTRQYAARQSSTPSDIEQDTPPHLSPADPAPPVPPRVYPGLAVPVNPSEVGTEPPKRNESQRHSPHYAPYASVPAPSRPPKVRESLDKDIAPILKASVMKGSIADRGRSAVKASSKDKTPHPTLLKSRSISPKKGEQPPIMHPNKRAFASHVRSKSSASLKPNRSFEGGRYNNNRDEVLLSLRDTYTRSLSTGSYIYDLLSRTRQVSPSHTEICLTHVPTKKSDKPIGPRGRNGDRLFTSRSLERPSTPRYDRSISPGSKIVSLPISRGRSRERSPSPNKTDFLRSIDRLRDSNITIPMQFGKDLPRSLTHEEEINLIIAGDANLLRMNTPDSFPSLDVQSSESIVSNESEYEMRF